MTKPFCLVKKAKSVFAGVIAISAMSLFVACGGDDNNPSAPPATSSDSGSVAAPASSGSIVLPGISSAAMAGTPNASAQYEAPFTFYTSPASTGLALTPDEDGFYAMGDVYKAVPKTSKIAFVIRHSKRQKSTGTESQLTPIGQQMAKDLGGTLVGDDEFHYASTNFVRTRNTAELIAEGRGEVAEVETWEGIDGAYFLTVPSDTLDATTEKSGGSLKYIARYAYGALTGTNAVIQKLQTYFYEDFFGRGNQFVNEVIVANIDKWKRVSVLVSHDVLVEPLIAFVSNRTINLKSFETPFHWVNYLSGIAVIVDSQNKITALPVKGDSVGWMIPAQEVKEE